MCGLCILLKGQECTGTEGKTGCFAVPGRQIAGKCKFFMNELNKSASGDTIYWIIS